MTEKTYPEMIVDSAICLYLANENADVTFDQIDKELGREPGFTFRFFNSQKDLNEKCVETLCDRAVETCCALLSRPGSAVARLREMYAFMVGEARLLTRLEQGQTRNTEAAAAQVIRALPLYQKLTAAMTELLREGKAEGAFTLEDPEACAAFIAFGFMGLRYSCADEQSKITAFRAGTDALLGL